MRLDRFLWFARITKTRSLAQDIAHQGHLRIDGRPVSRAAASVAIGQVLSFPAYGRVRAIRIEAIPARRGPPAEARACYTDLLADGSAGGEGPADEGDDLQADDRDDENVDDDDGAP